jgi:hypothetical protein
MKSTYINEEIRADLEEFLGLLAYGSVGSPSDNPLVGKGRATLTERRGQSHFFGGTISRHITAEDAEKMRQSPGPAGGTC